MRLPTWTAKLPALAFGLLTTACQGELLAPVGPGAFGTGPDGSGSTGETCAPKLAPRFVLLSDYQEATAIRSLLGEEALPEDDALSAANKPFTQKGVVVNTSLVHGRLSWAAEASRALKERFTELTACGTNGTDDCARRFIGEFAAKAFRRPVDDAEVDELMAIHALARTSSFVDGVSRMVEAVLSSPSFMYRSEVGEPADDGVVRLTDAEFAGALSFLLTDAPPDDALTQAAARGELSTEEGLTREVERLVHTPAAQASIVSTLMAAWGASNLFGAVKDPTLFPEFDPGLAASMFRETQLFLDDLFFRRDAPLSDVITARTTFVNARLAAVYGVPYEGAGDEFVEVELPASRRGILTQPGLLTMLARTDNTSVVARGLFVRGALLCLPKIPAPPASLNGAVQELLKADMTERERAEVRATTQPCGGCHAGFDGFGLMLENFDALGRERTMVGDEPVDTRVTLASAAGIEGDFAGMPAFADAIAESPAFTGCVAAKLLTYATGDDTINGTDCRVTSLLASLPDAPSLREVVHAVAASPALRLRHAEMP